METKAFEFKGTLTDSGVLEGLGAYTGNIDRGGDVIVKGAYKSLDRFVSDGAILVGHEWGSLPVAMVDDAKEVSEGLWFKATFHKDEMAQRARNIVKDRMEAGKSVGLSIGYSTMDAEMGQQDGKDVRFLKAIEVHEVSIVTVPMNPLARATGAKSFEDEYESALAAVKSVLNRAEHLKRLRESDGRKLSETNTQRIDALAAETKTLVSQIEALLAVSPAKATEEEVSEIRRKMCSLRLQLAGVR
jgi:HK97 family phage prohead protease